ncbi:unnamed protein product, partial [Iphiclides podalirius]
MIGAVPGAREATCGAYSNQNRTRRTPVLAKYAARTAPRPAHPLTEGRPYVIEFENYSKTLNNVFRRDRSPGGGARRADF